ncbi:histone-lysine N-methyltransferase SETMAR [Caerostris extrusa]|uniref:Histone-lysine N-methyltransferase SETMAR n=1 Tax=Caerostris extrusa TaxID=172846 RepID=A0AAV4VDH4_CAEEX|nr:histone-lysine N-methyltransferase SETMAR [Caerostris extrusa]
MEASIVDYRYSMLFFYRNGKNATPTENKKCFVYGEDAVAEITVRKCFARFRVGDFNKEYQEFPDRISTTDGDHIKILIENNIHYMTRELAEM